MRKSYKFRAYLNPETEKNTLEVLELCRQVYNLCLEQRRASYKTLLKSVNSYTQIKQLPELKEAFPEFKRIPSQSLQDVVERLDKAYQSFFRRIKSGDTPGYPRFKGYGRYDSLTLKQAGWELNGSNFVVKKLGTFKLKLHRQIPKSAKIKTVTIRGTQTNKWYVCFSCDNVPAKVLSKSKKTIAFDVGCESFLTDSNGFKIENPRYLKESQEKLIKLQQKLSKQKKGTKAREKTRRLLAKVYEKISNQRLDFHHKVAKHYVDTYGKIIHEKLQSWNSFRSLNKSMRDVAWFQFFNILHCKAEEAGREVVEVNPKNTSQICSQCGEMVKKELSERTHNCPHCNCLLDRDFNAALNILRLGTSLKDNPIPIVSSLEATGL